MRSKALAKKAQAQRPPLFLELKALPSLLKRRRWNLPLIKVRSVELIFRNKILTFKGLLPVTPESGDSKHDNGEEETLTSSTTLQPESQDKASEGEQQTESTTLSPGSTSSLPEEAASISSVGHPESEATTPTSQQSEGEEGGSTTASPNEVNLSFRQTGNIMTFRN